MHTHKHPYIDAEPGVQCNLAALRAWSSVFTTSVFTTSVFTTSVFTTWRSMKPCSSTRMINSKLAFVKQPLQHSENVSALVHLLCKWHWSDFLRILGSLACRIVYRPGSVPRNPPDMGHALGHIRDMHWLSASKSSWYIHMHTYIHTYIHTCTTCMHTYKYECMIYICVCERDRERERERECVCVCVFACAWACVCVCMRVCRKTNANRYHRHARHPPPRQPKP